MNPQEIIPSEIMLKSPLLAAVFKPNVTPNLLSQASLALFRAVVGIVMIHNGLDKLSNIESFAQAYVQVIGLPFPIFFSYLAAFTELFGAPLVALGLLTRPAALGLFSTMCVAMYHHILVAGFSIPYLELSAIYAVCFLFFVVNGGGLFSTDALIVSWLDANALSTQAKRLMRLERSYEASSVSEKVSL